MKASRKYTQLLEYIAAEQPKIAFRVVNSGQTADIRLHAETHMSYWLKTMLADYTRAKAKTVLEYFPFETLLAVPYVQTHGFQLGEAEQVHERLRSRVSDPFSWMTLPLRHLLSRLPVKTVARALLYICTQHRGSASYSTRTRLAYASVVRHYCSWFITE
jgi:hypothetical protein